MEDGAALSDFVLLSCDQRRSNSLATFDETCQLDCKDLSFNLYARLPWLSARLFNTGLISIRFGTLSLLVFDALIFLGRTDGLVTKEILDRLFK